MRRAVVALLIASSPFTAGAQGLQDLPNRMCYRGTGPGPAGSELILAPAFADSLAVLNQLDRAVRANTRDADAWYRRAMIAWALASSPPERAKDHVVEYTRLRQTADLSFQALTALNPPRVGDFLMAGKYYLTSEWTVSRAASYAYFREALEIARRGGVRDHIAQTAVEVARIYWRWYEGFGYNVDGIEFLRAQALLNEAYQAAPHLAEAYHNYAMLLADGDRWNELETLARDHLRHVPNDGWTWMTIGLARQRLRESRRARAVFDTALALLPASERARLDRYDRLLSRRDSAAHNSTDAATRSRVEARGWEHADPFLSHNDEDARVEFLARVTYAELRWSVPERGAHGADTDRGNAYVRYGPPARVSFAGAPGASPHLGADVSGGTIVGSSGSLPRNATDVSARATVPVVDDRGIGSSAREVGAPPPSSSRLPGHVWERWSFGGGLYFDFFGMRSFSHTCFDDPDSAKARIDREPNRWTNIALGQIDSIPLQVARFRADYDSVDVFVAAYAPVSAIRRASGIEGPVQARFWLHAWDSGDSVSAQMTLATDGMLRWIPRAAPGRYDYRIEATMDGALVGARSKSTVELGRDSATGFDTRGFGISDVLLAARADAPPTARRWNDVRITPVVDAVVNNTELTLVWENYEFGRGESSARYGVEIRFERADRVAPSAAGRIAAQIVGGIAGAIGISRRDEPDRLTIAFDREVPHSSILLDEVALSLAGTPPGRYTVTITVRDRVSGRATARALPLTIRG